jgi:hypothetical protein
MPWNIFLSFDYHRDLWRANVVRNSGVIEGVAAAGFRDASLWNETERKGERAVETLIRNALDNTSVTVVLIGAETASRKYITYEIARSIDRGNGLLGIHINHIKDSNGGIDPQGLVPEALIKAGAPIYVYEYGKLGEWVENAYRKARSSSSVRVRHAR